MQDDDINMPLISDNLDDYSVSSNSSTVDESGIRIDRIITSPKTHGIVGKGATYPTESHVIEGAYTFTPRLSSLCYTASVLFSFPLLVIFILFTNNRHKITKIINSLVRVGETHVIDVTNSKTEELYLGNTLKRPAVANGPTPDVKHIRRDSGESNHNGTIPDIIVGKKSLKIFKYSSGPYAANIVVNMHMLMFIIIC